MVDEKTKERYLFNIVAEAKAYAYVAMAKKYMPTDQVRQFCVEMLERAFKKEGIEPAHEIDWIKINEVLVGHCDLFEKREKELLAKIADVKKIVDEPDPHGEKYKQKLWRLKEMLQ